MAVETIASGNNAYTAPPQTQRPEQTQRTEQPKENEQSERSRQTQETQQTQQTQPSQGQSERHVTEAQKPPPVVNTLGHTTGRIVNTRA